MSATIIHFALVLFYSQFMVGQCTIMRSCENTNLTISCPTGSVINILSATFGRHRKDVCPGSNYAVRNTTCASNCSLDTVRKICQRQNSCTVASNNKEFDNNDPCSGVIKYLEVNYVCMQVKETIQSCENEHLSIVCPFGTVIKIISAMFGRQNKYTCEFGDFSNTSCNSSYSYDVVNTKCQDLPSCTILADIKVFHGDDQCVGFSKYLEVTYECAYEQIQCGVNEMIAPVIAYNGVVTFGCVCQSGFTASLLTGVCSQDK